MSFGLCLTASRYDPQQGCSWHYRGKFESSRTSAVVTSTPSSTLSPSRLGACGYGVEAQRVTILATLKPGLNFRAVYSRSLPSWIPYWPRASQLTP